LVAELVGRVRRGGSWYDRAGLCRSAYRGDGVPGGRHDNIGFRVATAIDTAKLKTASSVTTPGEKPVAPPLAVAPFDVANSATIGVRPVPPRSAHSPNLPAKLARISLMNGDSIDRFDWTVEVEKSCTTVDYRMRSRTER
jgi:hypothetical protein